MRIVQTVNSFEENNLNANDSLSSLSTNSDVVLSTAASTILAYNEMADVTVQMIDPVAEVEKNLAHLQELQARMKFMMREVRYLIKV